MQERERGDASGSGGVPAGEREAPYPAGKPAPQHARRAMARLVVTPTFIASASIVIVAIIAYGTTRTHLLYSGMGPACASASCTVSTPQVSGGAPNAESAKHGPKAGRGSVPGTPGRVSSTHGSGSSGRRSGSSSSPGGNNAAPPQPSPVATAGAGPARSRVVIVYRTLRSGHGGFLAAITISNRSKAPIKGWQFWMHYRSSRVIRITGARWFPSSPKVHDTGMAVPEPGQQTLRPGATIRFTIQSSGSPGAPNGCVFDGNHCSFGH